MKRKLATIRKDDGHKCPFGLPIPWACQHVNGVVRRMAPLKIARDVTEEEAKQIADANVKLLAWSLLHGSDQPGRCPYAGKIFPKHLEAVECNYEDSAPGQE